MNPLKFLFCLIFASHAYIGMAQTSGDKGRLETKVEKLKDLIQLYQSFALRLYKHPLSLIIEQSSEMDAYANQRGPVIGITEGTLSTLPDDAVLATVCHELGHFFGDSRFRLDPTRQSGIIEAEADYFAGYCLVNYYKVVKGYSKIRAEDASMIAARLEAPYFEKKRLVPERAYGETYFTQGWNRQYPEGECRLLTVLHGIKARQRPSCWYNPKR
jgi:Zn-dependent peptidase ImmA (M78 family)